MRLLLPKALRSFKERTRWATGEVAGDKFAQHVVLVDEEGNLIKSSDLDDGGFALEVMVMNEESLPVEVTNVTPKTQDVILQNAATSTGDGTKVNIGAYNEIILSVFGINVATSTVVFEVNDFDDNWTAVKGVKIGTDTTANSTSGIGTGTNTPGEKWCIPVKGCTQVRARVSVLTGASAAITVKGRLVL